MAIWTLVGGALAGGLTAVVVGFVGWQALRGSLSTGQRQKVLGILLVAPAMVAWYAAEPVGFGIGDRLGPPANLDDMRWYYDRQALHDPVLGPLLQSLPHDERLAKARKLATRGMPLLDDAQLQRRADLVGEILRVGSRAVAYGLYTGQQDPEQFFQALGRLKPQQRSDWFELAQAAMRAGVEGGKPRPIDRDEAMQALAASLVPATGARLLKILADRHPSAKDADFACKAIYWNLHRLDRDHRQKLNRVLAYP